MRLIDADNYIGKVIASHCYSGVNKVIRIDDVPTVDVNNLIIEEFEKIKAEIETYRNCLIPYANDENYYCQGRIFSYDVASALLEKRIGELKGEQE